MDPPLQFVGGVRDGYEILALNEIDWVPLIVPLIVQSDSRGDAQFSPQTGAVCQTHIAKPFNRFSNADFRSLDQVSLCIGYLDSLAFSHDPASLLWLYAQWHCAHSASVTQNALAHQRDRREPCSVAHTWCLRFRRSRSWRRGLHCRSDPPGVARLGGPSARLETYDRS